MNQDIPSIETATTTTTSVLDRRTKESLEEYDASVQRLAREFEEEAARLALDLAEAMPIEPDEEEYTEEERELDIEFGRLEAARDQHFELLEKTDKQEPKPCPESCIHRKATCGAERRQRLRRV